MRDGNQTPPKKGYNNVSDKKIKFSFLFLVVLFTENEKLHVVKSLFLNVNL